MLSSTASTALFFRHGPHPPKPQEVSDANAVHDADGLPLPRRFAAVAALLGAGVLVVLDGAIANVALPSIAQHCRRHPPMPSGSSPPTSWPW